MAIKAVMDSTIPSAQTWTIRFKYHKSTVLLHVEPNQTIDSLKESLLYALRDVKTSSNFLNGQTPPSSASQIQLAKLRNALDISEGWEPLEESSLKDLFEEDDQGNDQKKGKGKAKAKVESSGQTVRGIGIKDNAVLAFRWRAKENGAKKGDEAEFEEEDEWDERDEWDVVIPTFEDVYGVENSGDFGDL